jgi:hypothetical protein
MLELEGELETVREEKKRGRHFHLETFGKVAKIMQQYACECSESCEPMPKDKSYCGWAAKQAAEGKI